MTLVGLSADPTVVHVDTANWQLDVAPRRPPPSERRYVEVEAN